MRVLVLRAAEDAEPEVLSLRARGVDALAAPVQRYDALPAPDLDPFRGAPADLMVTSPRAVPAVAALVLDPAWRVLTIAPRTHEALLAAGVRVDRVVTGGAFALATAARPGPLLHLTSDLGGEETRRARPDAHLFVVYRTVGADTLPDAALAALAGPHQLIAHSPSALRHYARLVPGGIPAADAVTCAGATTAAEARRLGARRILQEPP